MRIEINSKLEELILKAIEDKDLGDAERLLALRETVAKINNFEK